MSNVQRSSSAVGLIGLGLMLAVGFIGSSLMIVAGVKTAISFDQRITVKGYATKKIKSDLAIWNASYNVKAKSLAEGYGELKKQLPVVVAYIKAQGFSDKELEVQTVSRSIVYKKNEKGYNTGEVNYFVVTQFLQVTTNKVEKANKIYNNFESLFVKNINVSSTAPKYFYTKVSTLKMAMLKVATKNARQRAEMLITGSSNRVGSLRSARQGVFQITAEHSTSVSGYGVLDTSSINKVMKAIVTIEYTIE